MGGTSSKTNSGRSSMLPFPRSGKTNTSKNTYISSNDQSILIGSNYTSAPAHTGHHPHRTNHDTNNHTSHYHDTSHSSTGSDACVSSGGHH